VIQIKNARYQYLVSVKHLLVTGYQRGGKQKKCIFSCTSEEEDINGQFLKSIVDESEHGKRGYAGQSAFLTTGDAGFSV